MDVNWMKFDKRIEDAKSASLSFNRVLESNWPEDYNEGVMMEADGIKFDFNLNSYLSSLLGSFWRLVYSNGDISTVKDVLRSYYKYKEVPNIRVDAIKLEGEGWFGIRNKVGAEEKHDINFGALIGKINESYAYDRLVVGTNGRNVEFQFLNSAGRVEASKDDFLDPGIFVNINGQVKLSAGLNRLVCTNGLTRHFGIINSNDFELSADLVVESANLITWLVERQNEKVSNAKELSVVLHCYPKGITEHFWGVWANKIGESKLTWYDVIADITNYANKYIDGNRIKLLEFPNVLDAYRSTLDCPVCHTKV